MSEKSGMFEYGQRVDSIREVGGLLLWVVGRLLLTLLVFFDTLRTLLGWGLLHRE